MQTFDSHVFISGEAPSDCSPEEETFFGRNSQNPTSLQPPRAVFESY